MTKEYPTQDRVRELLDYDPETGVLTWKVSRGRVKPGSRAGHRQPRGYRQVTVEGRRHLEHRLVWFHVHGQWPANEIDHVNRIKDDNRIANLREATTLQNRSNLPDQRRVNGLPRGVYPNYHGGRFRARIWDGSIWKERHLGTFDTPEEASEAFQAAWREIRHTF